MGLGIRPGQTWELIDSSIIMFNKDSDELAGWEGWVKRYKTFLEGYSKENKNAVACTAETELTGDQFCKFDLAQLGPCGKGNFVYFPFMNQKGYLPPLVAVQFNNVRPGQLLHVECRAWAKNIGYHKRDKIGRAHFGLMVHTAATAKALKGEL